ncbi:MAG: hypothetical protein ACRDD5_18390 [Silvania sp.]|uniref:hypothetical protein n=1 Tax=Silvania sp. TaxID=3016633 RepID=UPI003EE55174
MLITINKNDLYIELDKCENPDIKIKGTPLTTPHEIIIHEDTCKIKIPIKSIDIFKSEILVNGIPVDFEKYKLCRESYYNDFYMTESIVNAGARKFTNDELFFLIKNNINNIPHDCPYLGSMLTIISYRIIDDIENRDYLVEEIVNLKRHFDSKVNDTNPHSIRWFVSSAATMAMLLIATDRTKEAEEFLNLVKQNYHRVNLNPLCYWNAIQGMVLLSLIYINNEQWDLAGNLLLSQFVFSRNALLDIYNPRNDWLLGQLSDCTALLELGKLSLISSTRCLKNNIHSATRVSSFNGNNKPIDFAPLFIRFRGLEHKVQFFKSIREKLDVRKH